MGTLIGLMTMKYEEMKKRNSFLQIRIYATITGNINHELFKQNIKLIYEIQQTQNMILNSLSTLKVHI